MAKEPTLYARMELRLTDAEKRLARFQTTVDRSMGTMEKRTVVASTRMQKALSLAASGIGTAFTVAGAAAAAGLAVVLSLTAKAKEALDEFGSIADKSAQSGLDAETFQELAYGASLAGVGMDELSSSLNTFNKNAGLAVVGKGKMVAALKALNPALLENIRNAKTQEERIKLAADAIDQAKTASEKAALATTLFGNAGAALVPAFDGGADAIERTAEKARALGIIVDNELIARADELGDEYETVTKVLDVQFKQALINLGPVMIAAAQLAIQLSDAISTIVDSWRALDQQTNIGLNRQLATIGQQRLDIENKIIDAQKAQSDEAAKLSDTANNLGFSDTKNPALPGGNIDNLKAESAELKKQELAIVAIQTARNEAAKQAGDGKGNTNEAADPPPLPPITTGGGSTRNKAAEDALRQAEAVKELIANLEFERTLVGKSEVEQAKMNALRDAGATATEEQKAQISSLIETTAREKAAVESVKTAMSELNETAKDVAGTIIRGFRDGATAAEVLEDVATRLSDKLIDMLLNMAFPATGGGFLSSFFTSAATAAAGGSAGAVSQAAKVSAPRVQANRAAAARPGGGYGKVTVINNARADVKTEERDDGKGGRNVTFVLEEQVASAISRPGSAANKAMRSNFGVSQRLVKR